MGYPIRVIIAAVLCWFNPVSDHVVFLVKYRKTFIIGMLLESKLQLNTFINEDVFEAIGQPTKVNPEHLTV